MKRTKQLFETDTKLTERFNKALSETGHSKARILRDALVAWLKKHGF